MPSDVVSEDYATQEEDERDPDESGTYAVCDMFCSLSLSECCGSRNGCKLGVCK